MPDRNSRLTKLESISYSISIVRPHETNLAHKIQKYHRQRNAETSRVMSNSCRPLQPTTLLTLDPLNPDGYYIFGFPDFSVRPLRVANIFHRSFFGSHEDFILGVLSVLLIALLTEICHVILMRTTRRSVSRSGFQAAFVLDEITHFRNVFHHLRYRTRSKLPRSVLWSSITVLAFGATLIAAEVLAVYITQPFKVYAPASRYNLRGVQPVMTTDNAAVEVDILTEKKRCVSPMMPGSNHSRDYSIFACVNRKKDNALSNENHRSTFVQFESWFHKAGSDHYITYGNDEVTGTHEISTRASIMQSALGIHSGLMFEVNQTTLPEYARFLHARAVQIAAGKQCDRYPSPDCQKTILDECRVGNATARKKTITLWEVKEDTGVQIPVTETVEGVVSRFKVELRAPGTVLADAFRIFATSAAIEEVVDGEGMYVSMPHGEEYHSMEGLVSEEGRIAGVVLLGLILIAMLALLVVLRVILRPVSLARLARNAIEAEDEELFDEEEGCIKPSPGVSLGSSSVWALERDIVDSDFDYDGYNDMFDLPKDSPKRGFWNFRGREPD